MLLDQYRIANGDHAVLTGSLEGQAREIVVWTLFILSVFLTQITFLNMLIGIMGDTFSRVSEIREQMALAEKIKIIADYVIIVRKSPADEDKFLY